ncbi:hypothetical protein N9L43_00055 [bacterium]|nr:hypothetical protein [bacterium]MDB2656715.1 hypothetical protein [Crocinitomicaceae bacterium]MDB3906882.1 hypothetical protein [Crocinitomicaceae bacterium]
MSYKVTDFPQYRKLSNEKVFYRIRDDRNFDEIQLVGSRAALFSMEAKQYPEILKIQDLLELSDGFLKSSQNEFDALMKKHNLG